MRSAAVYTSWLAEKMGMTGVRVGMVAEAVWAAVAAGVIAAQVLAEVK